MIRENKNDPILDMVEESLKDMAKIKDVSVSLKEFDKLRFPSPKLYTARDLRRIRKKLRISQAVLAHLLNTQLSTIQKWERGVNVPSGPASRLLQILESKGAKAFMAG